MMHPNRDSLLEFISDIEPYFYGRKVIYVDVGACVGTTFKAFVQSRLEVVEAHLVEPNPASFDVLRTLSAKNIKNQALHMYNLALGASAGTVCMSNAGTMSRVISKDPPTKAECSADLYSFLADCSTLDELSASFIDGRASILKIDAEGSEEEVLTGASKLLSRQAVDVIYVEAGANPDGSQQCYFTRIDSLMQRHGYRLFRIYEQRHEWLEDLPLLRRMNLAYFSNRFADSSPYRLTQERFAAVDELQQALADRERLIPHLEKRLTESENQVENVRMGLGDRDHRISELESKVSEQVRICDELQQALADRERLIPHLEKRLIESEKQVEDVRMSLGDRAHRISELESKVSEQIRICDELESVRTTAEERIKQLERQLFRSDAARRFAVEVARRRTQSRKFGLGSMRRIADWLGEKLERRRAERLLQQSLLFDPEWYGAKHPEALRNPIRHFLEEGALEGFDPHPLFDTRWYIQNNLPALRGGLNPLVHYLTQGAAIGLSPHRLFHAEWYLRSYPEALKGGDDALTHYLSVGASKGYNPNPDFDSNGYRRAAGGLPADVNPLVHFVTEGQPKRLAVGSSATALSAQETRRPATGESSLSRKTERTIVATRTRLLSFGMHKRAAKQLQELVDQQEDRELRCAAALELAAFQASAQDADLRPCLSLLDIAGERAGKTRMRQISILKIECLQRLGKQEEAKNIVKRLLSRDTHPDIVFAAANLEPSVSARLEWINECFRGHELAEVTLNGSEHSPFEQLRTLGVHEVRPEPAGADPLVSVIVPAYNSARSIKLAIESLLSQSWSNVEILVVDDCSSDGTTDVVKQYAGRDDRIRLLTNERNYGPYVARNVALLEAKGEFITCHDADDWSHAAKIEIQLRHLRDHPEVVANLSPQVRAFDDLLFYRRGKLGRFVHPNMSSLMFRKTPVVEAIGYWDSVRFAGDSEYLQRIKRVFGKHAVTNVEGAPLSFQKQSAHSLTGDPTFGYNGYKMGARLAYENAHVSFYTTTPRPFIGFPLKERPFAVPEPMRPIREAAAGAARRFDVVLVSDFRFPGGTSGSNLEELKVQSRLGLRTGLVQLYCYELEVERAMHPGIRRMIDEGDIELLVHGENVACDLLVVRQPWVLQDWQAYVPHIQARNLRVIVNQPPRKSYGKNGRTLYSISDCVDNMKSYFGETGTWHPIGPLVRGALEEHHANELRLIELAAEDWVNIIDVEEWRRSARPARGERTRICRHSRDSYLKWPSNREELVEVYPSCGPYELHVLGGAESPKKLLGGKLPSNWQVFGYGEVAPRDFLAGGDVFVYFTHHNWVESFGRVIIEAMAVGVPVVLPPTYESLFQEAAIYADPSEVLSKVDNLMADDNAYEAQVECAAAFVSRRFGHGQHERRLKEILR